MTYLELHWYTGFLQQLPAIGAVDTVTLNLCYYNWVFHAVSNLPEFVTGTCTKATTTERALQYDGDMVITKVLYLRYIRSIID